MPKIWLYSQVFRIKYAFANAILQYLTPLYQTERTNQTHNAQDDPEVGSGSESIKSVLIGECIFTDMTEH